MEPLHSVRESLIYQLPDIDKDLKVLKKLGEGAFGTAHLVLQLSTGQERVIKHIRKGGDVSPEALAQEVKLLKALDHPNIIHMYGYYEDYRHLYILMEPAQGGELLAVMRRLHEEQHNLTEAWPAQVFQQCLSAMAYCHDRLVVHKENIMLLGQDYLRAPHAVVIDFGIAEVLSPAKGRPRGRLQLGTYTTMAPEVWRANFGPKADVWSLGCVLFEMLSGTLPFLAKKLEDGSEWLRLHQAGPDWKLVGGASKEARQLCWRMLVVDERVRPTSQQCLRHRWFSHTENSPHTLHNEALRALSQIHEQSVLERVISLNIVTSLNTSNLRGLTELFGACDVDRNGTLSAEELSAALRSAGVADAAIKQMEEALQGRFRCMEYTSFLAGTLSACEELLDELLWKEFTKVDKDRSGYLSKRELDQLLKGVGCADLVFSQVDTTHDGKISFDEFRNHFRRRSSSGKAGEGASPTTGKTSAPMEALHWQQAGDQAPGLKTMNNCASDVDLLLDELERDKILTGGRAAQATTRVVPQEVAEAIFDHGNINLNGSMSGQDFGSWVADLVQSTPLCASLSESKVMLNLKASDVSKESAVAREEWEDLLNAVAEVVGPSALRKLAEDWSAPEPPAAPVKSAADELDGLIQELGM